MQKPLEAHWLAALWVVRHLKGTPDQGIMLKAACNMQISAYCDADWSACPITRRSVSAYVIFLGDSLVSW